MEKKGEMITKVSGNIYLLVIDGLKVQSKKLNDCHKKTQSKRAYIKKIDIFMTDVQINISNF